ncbi:MAG TPA: SPFH domain-containing protein, partial [Gemmataceae bacterium]|nr:SPFH domain-containing protein [Gemmataceae bacterium]
KGVMEGYLPEGRYFLNPVLWSYEVHDMVTVKPGTCLVLTRKAGRPIPPDRLAAGDVLAGDGERGVVAEVLKPGSHRINPYVYDMQEVPYVSVTLEQVGVRTSKVGKDSKDLPAGPVRGRYVVPHGYRGVEEEVLPPGDYYINPFVHSITPVEVRSHRAELTDIVFPSRDGFTLKPHVVVEYAVRRGRAAELFVRLADEGKLHQEDATPEQQQKNEILQKVILPHIRGYARLTGSNLDARDFIVTESEAGAAPAVNNREVLQRTLLEKVKPQCEELGIDILALRLGTLDPPPELAEQISLRDVARAQLAKNKTLIEQHKTKQKLAAAEALTQQTTEKVAAETRLLQAKTQAAQKKEVTQLQLENDLKSAQLKLEAAREQAKATLAKGKVEADVIGMQNEAQIAGLRRAVESFAGPQYYAQFQLMSKIAPALSEIFASDQSDFARLFAGYFTPQNGKPAGPPRPAAPVAGGPEMRHAEP